MQHKIGFVDFVKQKKQKFDEIKSDLKLLLVMSSNNDTGNDSTSFTENSLLHLCKRHKIDYEFFSSENDFIKYILQNPFSKHSYTLVYNQSFNGPLFSRRILIPAFCGYNELEYIGNDAYRMGLLCDKFHYYSILKNIGIPIADFWYYHYASGWLTEKPSEGLKVIMKLSNENNKISLRYESVFPFNNDFEEAIHSLSLKYTQGVILQKFIVGYEATVPAIIDRENIYTPHVLGLFYEKELRHGHKFMTEEYFTDIRHQDKDKKYFNFDIINTDIQPLIKEYSHKIIKILGIKGFTRVDLRIDDSWGIYFNDVGSMPSISPGGAFQTIYEMNGMSHEDFLITTICMNYE